MEEGSSSFLVLDTCMENILNIAVADEDKLKRCSREMVHYVAQIKRFQWIFLFQYFVNFVYIAILRPKNCF